MGFIHSGHGWRDIRNFMLVDTRRIMEHSIEYRYEHDHTMLHREFCKEIHEEVRRDPTTYEVPVYTQRNGKWIVFDPSNVLEQFGSE